MATDRMHRAICCLLLPAALICLAAATRTKAAQPPDGAAAVQAPVESGFRTIFNGSTLEGWDGDPGFWHVENGSIIGESTRSHQPAQNTFLIWRGGEPADFEFKAEYRLSGLNQGNSGIQYRSVELPDVAKWVMKGYQADIDLKQQYTGQIYEERGRTFLALRGQLATVPASGAKPGLLGSLGDSGELRRAIHDADWNEIDIIARGNVLTQIINGRVMSSLVDDDAEHRKMRGLIGIQLHRLPQDAMRIQVRNVRLKTF